MVKLHWIAKFLAALLWFTTLSRLSYLKIHLNNNQLHYNPLGFACRQIKFKRHSHADKFSRNAASAITIISTFFLANSPFRFDRFVTFVVLYVTSREKLKQVKKKEEKMSFFLSFLLAFLRFFHYPTTASASCQHAIRRRFLVLVLPTSILFHVIDSLAILLIVLDRLAITTQCFALQPRRLLLFFKARTALFL